MTPVADETKNIPLNDIDVVSNTRTDFNENGLKEMALSIKTNGVIEPIIVKLLENGRYRLICGERRYRASLLARKADIPAHIKDIPDNKILQTQIVENLQRRALSTMDEVRAIVRLRDEEDMSNVEIAKAIGKALSHVDAQIRISKAQPEVHEAIEKNQITRQVGLIISGLDSPDKQQRAVAALKRDKVAHLIKAKDAEDWINRTFGAQPKKRSPNGGSGQNKPLLGRFASDWKYYLIRFSAEQFEKFQTIVKSQTETTVWAGAVETIMTEGNSHVAVEE